LTCRLRVLRDAKASPLEWNATLLEGDVADEVRKLKDAGQSLLVYGSGELVKTLMQHDLIDVYRLMLNPPALACGKRFLRDGCNPTLLKLSAAKPTGTGVAVLTYKLAESPS
jgi:dihydrofolate reductase